MNITVEKQDTTETITVKRKWERAKDDAERLERHRATSKLSARRRYKEIRTEKWKEALEYLLTLEGDIDDLAPMMADKYNISKLKY